ncbi:MULTISPECIES: ethanolamine ammonia-lyase subunit EutC [unclassified Cupriavidus]|uniref:ethanolamine ammonia-lyase subunit EutC n=1 Tax=unclassified Cupriavidus TaxID=2640874 RepID=UPI001C000D4C|nr:MULTISPECIES: ethanolamine ammonia-lyase subunit EutC [unclassified Cupriavidus]MCA3187412.1 ethanolamine ammonia-lyase subunit EutC [Cupriavidus sp.]MCA3193531.1 ethanolamine ammonia-lyase subunit EutC [Cupriavidus sp.]MCA3199009.1 ethanolamine ammonia-lyase subunit EutC [Cupriavidus sp.]MCA3203408.1 ethanolamine ammonia-lyase subunit EutC [Cupriavidus sp.]MCA3209519.1 ethanolamine ammonia-lyase subunit EutC [Cupriavidus sp.]
MPDRPAPPDNPVGPADAADAANAADPWHRLRQFTRARVAIGRTGHAQTTETVLAFGLAHAQARDAVHLPLDAQAIDTALRAAGLDVVHAHSAAPDRDQYLRRPDLGRRLDDDSRAALMPADHPHDVVFVIADGLSALAAQRHGVPLLQAVLARLPSWRIGPVVVARQARVALGDEIGERLQARQVVMLIGERPGLSSPDSLGIYLTYDPRVGRTDAQRNCISNVRPEGLAYAPAADRLAFLLRGAVALGRSGVDLKDNSAAIAATLPGT